MIRSFTNINPIAELQQMADMMDRAFGDFREGTSESTEMARNWNLPIDVYERGGKLVVKASIAGIKPEDVDVSIENNVLTISGSMEEEREENDRVYRREYRYGTFSRSLRLPENIDTNKVEASFENGVVKVTLPREGVAKPKALKVPVKASAKQSAIEATAHESGKHSNKTESKEKNGAIR